MINNVRKRSDTSWFCKTFHSCKIYEKLVNIRYVRYTEKFCRLSDAHYSVDSALPVRLTGNLLTGAGFKISGGIHRKAFHRFWYILEVLVDFFFLLHFFFFFFNFLILLFHNIVSFTHSLTYSFTKSCSFVDRSDLFVIAN